MSNDVSIFKSQSDIATTRDSKLSPLAQKLASSGGVSRRIQTNTNGTFKRLVNGEQIGNALRGEIDVIIVGALPKVSRIYYATKYDPDGEPTLPNCWSNLGDKPEWVGVPEPQSATCLECPQNIVGSGDKGGRACRYQRRISVLVAGDTSGEVYQFNIPAKSLFGKGSGNVHPFESYIKYLIANLESPDNVVTNVSYDINADTMELQFLPLRNINDVEYDMVVAAQGRPETDMYTKITVAQADGVVKTPAKPTPPPAITRSDEPEDDDEEEITVSADEEAPVEPVKRASKKAKDAAVATATSMDDVIDAWGG